jgi:hypothetical protein
MRKSLDNPKIFRVSNCRYSLFSYLKKSPKVSDLSSLETLWKMEEKCALSLLPETNQGYRISLGTV